MFGNLREKFLWQTLHAEVLLATHKFLTIPKVFTADRKADTQITEL